MVMAPSKTSNILAEDFDRHAAAINRFAYQYLGNRADAEEVTRRVFLNAAPAPDVASGGVARQAHLFCVARSAIVDIWRSYGANSAIHGEWSMAEPSQLNSTPAGDAASKVRSILERLEVLPRRVLELRLLEGRSLGETARQLGISEASTRALQHQALRQAAENARSASSQ